MLDTHNCHCFYLHYSIWLWFHSCESTIRKQAVHLWRTWIWVGIREEFIICHNHSKTLFLCNHMSASLKDVEECETDKQNMDTLVLCNFREDYVGVPFPNKVMKVLLNSTVIGSIRWHPRDIGIVVKIRRCGQRVWGLEPGYCEVAPLWVCNAEESQVFV